MTRSGVRWLVVLWVLALAGCLSAYHPDSLLYNPQKLRWNNSRYLGCVDLEVWLRDMPVDGQPVSRATFQFGNRCAYSVTLDFTRLRVEERGEVSTVLRPYDPDQDLRPARLDAHGQGIESLDYRVATGNVEVCVDPGDLNTDNPRRERTPLCFRRDRPPGPERMHGLASR